MAIQFCARKVSSVNGDIRKALDICRRAVEIVEAREKGQSGEGCGLKVSIGHIASVIEEVYGNKSRASEEVPLQQKLAAASLLLLVSNGAREPTLEKVSERGVADREYTYNEGHTTSVPIVIFSLQQCVFWAAPQTGVARRVCQHVEYAGGKRHCPDEKV